MGSNSTTFNQFPTEILLLILSELIPTFTFSGEKLSSPINETELYQRQRTLSTLSTIDRAWNEVITPYLYHGPYLFTTWQLRLFHHSLTISPFLCAFVRCLFVQGEERRTRLGVRNMTLKPTPLLGLSVQHILQHCTSLQSMILGFQNAIGFRDPYEDQALYGAVVILHTCKQSNIRTSIQTLHIDRLILHTDPLPISEQSFPNLHHLSFSDCRIGIESILEDRFRLRSKSIFGRWTGSSTDSTQPSGIRILTFTNTIFARNAAVFYFLQSNHFCRNLETLEFHHCVYHSIQSQRSSRLSHIHAVHLDDASEADFFLMSSELINVGLTGIKKLTLGPSASIRCIEWHTGVGRTWIIPSTLETLTVQLGNVEVLDLAMDMLKGCFAVLSTSAEEEPPDTDSGGLSVILSVANPDCHQRELTSFRSSMQSSTLREFTEWCGDRAITVKCELL
ncbi:hypothetical protein ABKN59_011847 [Abortiporus biennis]